MSRFAVACWAGAVLVGASAGFMWVHASSGPSPTPVFDLQMALELPSPVIQGGTLVPVSGTTSIVGGPSPATLDLAFVDADGQRFGPTRIHTILKRDGTWSFTLPAVPLTGRGTGSVEATLMAGGRTVTKTYGLTMTGGDFEVNLAATPRAWAYENDGAKTANRNTIALAASVANDSGGSTGYTYTWRALPHPITGKALVLVSGGGEGDAAATFAAPQAPAASKTPYVVTCEVVGQGDLGLETGNALAASMVTVRLLGDANGDDKVTVTDFSIWKTQNGQTGGGLSADFNGDGNVTVTDFSMWKVNNGQAVPE